jgi:hypothetical protein
VPRIIQSSDLVIGVSVVLPEWTTALGAIECLIVSAEKPHHVLVGDGARKLSPLKVCLVKQASTYDLYTRTGPDVRSIVESSNWRSGPIGLWEALSCDFRVVHDNPAPECQFGKSLWAKYVEGWDLLPNGAQTEAAEDVDWSAYDAVISVDVAVPTAVVMRHPDVLWCYTVIEVHTTGKYDRRVLGHPRFGYNVLLNHHMAKAPLGPSSRAVTAMRRERRAILDFPYYVQSSRSVQLLYPELTASPRDGITFTQHSRAALTEDQRRAVARLGSLKSDYTTCADLLRTLTTSKYLIYHPDVEGRAGNAVIEAVSAGTLVLAPLKKLIGYPELLLGGPEFEDFAGLLDVLEHLEADPQLYAQERDRQARRVDSWCYETPLRNLEYLTEAFKGSSMRQRRQVLGERRDLAAGYAVLGVGAARRRLLAAAQWLKR